MAGKAVWRYGGMMVLATGVALTALPAYRPTADAHSEPEADAQNASKPTGRFEYHSNANGNSTRSSVTHGLYLRSI